MHDIEPHFSWRLYYTAETDERSPFFGREYSEIYFTHTIYNHYIHPQWDDFGSETLFLKIIYTDYQRGFTIIEMLGEWNDCLFNDIMFLKRNVLEVMMANGIKKFILIGENVFNFHSSDDSYYEEWFDELEDGWIVGLNFRRHVRQEFFNGNLDEYIMFGGVFDHFGNWRTFTPVRLFTIVEGQLMHRLNP